MSESVVSRLDNLVERLRPASRWAVEAALTVLVTEGVGGTLVVEIPRNTRHEPEASFLVGRQEFNLSDRRH